MPADGRSRPDMAAGRSSSPWDQALESWMSEGEELPFSPCGDDNMLGADHLIHDAAAAQLKGPRSTFFPLWESSPPEGLQAERFAAERSMEGSDGGPPSDNEQDVVQACAGSDGARSKPTTKRRAPRVRVATVSLASVSQCFAMPIEDAARALGVGVTVLKRKCREFGISRWPHRKLKSLETLIHNIQGYTEEDGMEQATMVTNALHEERNALLSEPESKLRAHTKLLRQATFKNSFNRKHQKA